MFASLKHINGILYIILMFPQTWLLFHSWTLYLFLLSWIYANKVLFISCPFGDNNTELCCLSQKQTKNIFSLVRAVGKKLVGHSLVDNEDGDKCLGVFILSLHVIVTVKKTAAACYFVFGVCGWCNPAWSLFYWQCTKKTSWKIITGIMRLFKEEARNDTHSLFLSVH